MDTTLAEILKPTQEIDGVRYFHGEIVLGLALAVSDYGRDYEVAVPFEDSSYAMKIGGALDRIYSGKWTPDSKIMDRFRWIDENLPGFALKAIQDLNSFTYSEPRRDGVLIRFDPLNSYADLPQEFLNRFAAAHFGVMRKRYLRDRIKNGFLGEVGGKINGTDLFYFESRYVDSRIGGYGGFFLHNFFDSEDHLVTWKTGLNPGFQREGKYTVIGGTVKSHDQYREDPPKTILSRAKFFDHQSGDAI